MSEKENTSIAGKKQLSPQMIVIIVLIGLVITLPTSIYIWKIIQISNLKKEHKTEVNDIRIRANRAITDNNKKNIETLTRVFSWAVRSEMLRNNMDQVNIYMNQLVKTSDLKDVSLIKTDGIVLLSTNKKFEGNAYPSPVAKELGNINEVMSRNDPDGNIMSICPVMGLDNRMGTIVITYKLNETPFGKAE
jgi:hypothetical protein